MDLVFTAKMDFRPNVDAVLWFAQEVMPLIRQEIPDSRFWAVGKNPHSRLAMLVDDLEHRLAVFPVALEGTFAGGDRRRRGRGSDWGKGKPG